MLFAIFCHKYEYPKNGLIDEVIGQQPTAKNGPDKPQEIIAFDDAT
jgi:hypothetical protein